MGELKVKWPCSFATVYDGAVDPSLLAALREDAGGIARSPNFWLPAEHLEHSEAACTVGEQVVQQLYAGIVKERLAGQRLLGAEWWVQVYSGGRGLAFHFDKDEAAFKGERIMHHPLLSSVLHLVGDPDRPPAGPTVVVDQRYDNSRGCAEPDAPQRCALVYPAAGRYMLFDGRLGHGVLDTAGTPPPESGSSCQASGRAEERQGQAGASCREAASAGHGRQQRMTLLVNWWTSRQPQGVERVSSQQLEGLGLSRLSIRDEASSGQEAHPDAGAAAAPAGTSGAPSVGRAGAQPAAAAVGTAAMPRQAQVPVISLPAGEDEPIMVDDLLAAFDIRAFGPKAVAGVAIEHPGFQLYPIADQPGAVTAAALVPVGMMQSSDDSDDDNNSHQQ